MTGRARLGLVSAAMLLAWSVPAIGIVGGKEVTEVEQLRRGLVTVGGGCSGILISEDWVITAGHCVPKTRPNPQVTVRAAWNGGVSGRSDAIYQFADASTIHNPGPEFALIHLSAPFPGIAIGYRLQFYPGTLESLVSKTIAKYGQGLSSYAEQNSTTGPVPPEGQGVYRAADLRVHAVAGTGITYHPTDSGQVLLPGDSGGPGLIWENGLAFLAGITSTARWDCFNKTGATPADVNANCRGSIYQQHASHDVAIPPIKAALEAVLKTKWNPAATSEPVWVLRPEIELTPWPLADANVVHWAHAARIAAKLCYNRGFAGGHFDGHQDVANGGYGLQCSGQGTSWQNVSVAQIAATQWGFTNINTVTWAQANRAAERLCAAQGRVGGHFNGHMSNGQYGLFCYSDNAQWFDATKREIDATNFGFHTERLDEVPWAQAARAAVGFCRAKGFSGGFLNGHHVPGKFGVVCQK